MLTINGIQKDSDNAEDTHTKGTMLTVLVTYILVKVSAIASMYM